VLSSTDSFSHWQRRHSHECARHESWGNRFFDEAGGRQRSVRRPIGAEASDAVSRKLFVELESIKAKISTLTPRERQVFMHVTAGRLNKQIAGDLGTVEKTIKVHRKRVMEKLEVRTLIDLVRMAEKAGIRK
jgi:FixJ family two-component response regulator